MIGRIAHSVRLLLRIGEMTVPSILGRRGCAPVIGPSDEGPKCRAHRAIRRVSVCRVCVLRQRRVRVLGLLATALGEHARGFTPPYIENLPRWPCGGACVGPVLEVCVAHLWSPRGHRVSTISPRITSMPFKLSLTAARSSCGCGTIRTNVLPCALASDGTIARHPSPRRSRTRGTMPIHSTT